ncbi:MAG: acyl carrier protein [Acidimicrobiia bacterium]
MPDVEQVIRDYLVREHMEGFPEQDLSADMNLIDEEIIDSLGIFSLIGYISETFGVEVDPEEVTLENFESIASISQLVSSKLGSRAGG